MDRQKLFAAQPIYTRDNQIFAYELLYRHDSGLTAFDIGEEVATSELIYNLCTGIAEHVEHFQHPVCINVTADFLLSKAFL
ncbi:MAG: intracellular signaling protein, partial [Gammaproteobacteria bacterium]|nr:intracellular signaling protein [Gammaproteobacteria bacterium]